MPPYLDKEEEGNINVAWYKNQACSQVLWRSKPQNSKKSCEFLEGCGAVSVTFQNFSQDISKHGSVGVSQRHPGRPCLCVYYPVCLGLCALCCVDSALPCFTACSGDAAWVSPRRGQDVKFFLFPSTIEACPWGCCSASQSFLYNLGSSFSILSPFPQNKALSVDLI